jgi:hypothetical protein
MRFGRATGRTLGLAFLAAAAPVALLMDVLRPLVLERDLIFEVGVEHASEEEVVLLNTSDLLFMAVSLATILVAGFLAWRGRDAALLKLALLIWSTGVTLVTFETGMRWLARPMVYRPDMRLTLHPDPRVLPGTSARSRFSTNRRGMRATEWDPAARRILCVGGSTTICLYLDDEKAWPQRLMALLNAGGSSPRYWVGNVGKSGHDTYHHLELLRRLPEASQVRLVIVLAGVNDLAHALRVSRASRRRLAASAVFDVGGPTSPLLPYVKQTLAYQGLRLLARSAEKRRLDEEDPRGLIYDRRRARRRQAPRDLPLPELAADIRAYRDNLAAIAALCRGWGSRCLFLTQPTLWQDPMPPELEATTWFGPLRGTGRTLSSADLGRGMALFNQATLDLCRERADAECVDLASEVPKDAVDFYDEEHFTEAGAERVAHVVADYLLSPRDASVMAASAERQETP